MSDLATPVDVYALSVDVAGLDASFSVEHRFSFRPDAETLRGLKEEAVRSFHALHDDFDELEREVIVAEIEAIHVDLHYLPAEERDSGGGGAALRAAA